jgi:hypothetical protein
MTTAGGRGAFSGVTGITAHGESRNKVNFNVLLEELTEPAHEAPKEEVGATEATGKPQEESLDQLLAPAVISPTSSMADESEWATASSSRHQKTRKPSQAATRPLNASTASHPPPQSSSSVLLAPTRQQHDQQQQQQHHQNAHHAHGNMASRPPKEPVSLSQETTLEFYDFPASFRTADLKSALLGPEGGPRFRIKWNNDTSCWFVFDCIADRDLARKTVEEYIASRPEESKFKVRVYDPAHHPLSPASN